MYPLVLCFTMKHICANRKKCFTLNKFFCVLGFANLRFNQTVETFQRLCHTLSLLDLNEKRRKSLRESVGGSGTPCLHLCLTVSRLTKFDRIKVWFIAEVT